MNLVARKLWTRTRAPRCCAPFEAMIAQIDLLCAMVRMSESIAHTSIGFSIGEKDDAILELISATQICSSLQCKHGLAETIRGDVKMREMTGVL